MNIRVRTLVLAALAAFVVASCGGGGGGEQPATGPAGEYIASTPRDVPMDRNAYPALPDPDAGADPSVPAAQGGRGFTGEGWETNVDFDLIGDPRAVKGGVFREEILDFPANLRLHGPESNSELNYMINPMVYETLLTLHPTTLEWMPALATHWQVSDDQMTFRYRINPNARYSDGQPVVAQDVVATWNFVMDEGLQDPSNRLVFGKFERPVAESKYIVRVRSRDLNWRNFLYFSGSMYVLPAHVLAKVNGATYLKEYNYKLLPGSGAYSVNEADIVKGQSVSIRRRNDYWAEKHRRNVGVYNFDEVREIVVRDTNLSFEMFKRGDLDYFYFPAPSARQWVEETDFDNVQRGLIQKRKIFNDTPRGFSGIALNTRREPWNDVRVRQAFAHLLNRDLLIQKIFFNEYVALNTYHPGSIYENPDNPKMTFDPNRAMALFREAGWAERDAQGRLVKGGRPLTVEVLYATQDHEPFLTIYQEDLRRVGIGLNLRLVTPETMFQLVSQRQFDTVVIGWGGLLFPNPETMFHSNLADVPNNNNLTGFKSTRVDTLLAAYDREFDAAKRAAIIREIDGIVANEHHYVLRWDAPFVRVAFWNKFGHPESYFTRIGDYTEPPTLWWIDPQKEQRLAEAMGNSSIKLPVGETENRFWEAYAARQKAAPTGTSGTN
jgi:microcin C transport system substrate-binding protein